ncbi:MAG: UDP-3-O-(3-hydroxymyristoyl)glucosamine N-acyltransferase [Planctomycetota bacterium]|nr:UDP-3-O-(3-hydroxymyristoyl)glucosamine N-acyltransferase [Planctomycetota bacterium]MDA1212064.1 UDP-3-O-(3-hydroxymyristoyl)glucosamine N-acyltransferase [Planctomycetota bacterium]
MVITSGDLAQRLHAEIVGDTAREIRGAQSADRAGISDITFIENEKNLRRLKTTQAGSVLLPTSLRKSITQPTSQTLLFVSDPLFAFLNILEEFRPARPRPAIGISPEASIDPSVQLGENCNVFPGAYISDDVVIGNGCDVYPGVFVGPGCRIGANVVIYPNAVLYSDVIVGDRAIIHAGAIIGSDGFGYRFHEGRYRKIPHRGGVRIECDAEIGAGTTIDRAMIGMTVIGEGTKLDNQVMIAHNCELGKHNAFASQVGLAGSVTTGDYVRCAGQVGIADHIHLGERSLLGPKAGVHKDVPAGESYQGYPAAPEAEQLRTVMSIRRVPDMRKQIRELQNHVGKLTTQIEKLVSEAGDSASGLEQKKVA